MENQIHRSSPPYLASARSPANLLAAGSQAHHSPMEEPWLIIGRYVRVAAMEAQAEVAAAVDAEPQAVEDVVDVDADAEHAAAVPEADFTLLVERRPAITVLAAGRGAHPDPDNPDGSPYILAADPYGLLVHFTGTLFRSDCLVVMRRFYHTAEGQATASAERVPSRIINMDNVAFACTERGNYTIAVLQIPKRRSRTTLIQFKSGGDGWVTTRMASPLPAQEQQRRRKWSPHGAVSIAMMLWWFDLSWGIVSYDCSNSRLGLTFHQLPHGHTLSNGEVVENIQQKRCIAASQGKLVYVEIIPTATGEAAALLMWSRCRVQGGWQWEQMYDMSFDEIWGDESYKRTELPRNVPALAVVSPSNPGLVYFALEEHIFGVNIPARKVEHYKAYKLVQPRIASGRYVAAWSLQFQPAIAQAQGPPLGAQRLQKQGVLLADVPESSGGRTHQQMGMALESLQHQLSALGTNPSGFHTDTGQVATENDAAQTELPDDEQLQAGKIQDEEPQTLEEKQRLEALRHLHQSAQWIASENTLALGKVPLDQLSVGTPGAGVIGVISSTTSVDSSAVKTKEVWRDDLEATFEEISTILRDKGDKSYLVAFDTEFAVPDEFERSKGEPKDPDAHYKQLCAYVNAGDLVQVGLGFVDEDYNLVGGKMFQFNIQFDPKWRRPDHKGVQFMIDVGLNLEEHAKMGIKPGHFMELMSASGVLGNNTLSWVTFMGYIDFGHLIKLLRGSDLPASREDFLDEFRARFPSSYDCKVFSKFGKCINEPVPGRLVDVASRLEVKREGGRHHAASDALLTLRCHRKLMRLKPEFGARICTVLYGVCDMTGL